MAGHIFVVQGDLTRLQAHALVFSTSADAETPRGTLGASFTEQLDDFGERFREVIGPYAEDGALEPGEARWIPIPGDTQPYGVVAVALGRERRSRDPSTIEAVTKNSLRLAVRELRKQPGLKEKRVLIALPALGTGHGGMRHQRLQAAEAAMRAAVTAVRRYDQVDVAFVTYKPDTYEIYLQARANTQGAALPAVGELPGRLLDALRDEECALFVGAGLSQEAGLPSWSALIRALAERAKIAAPAHSAPEEFLRIAQECRDRDSEQVDAVIRGVVGEPGRTTLPSLAHYFLLSLPIRLFITTNYDSLIERTLEALRRYPVRIVRQEDVVHTGTHTGVYVVKFHGDAEHPRDGVVLTRRDYATFFRRRPAMALLLQGLLLNQTLFFVGYSLGDPNLRQMVDQIDGMLKGASRKAFVATWDGAKAATDPWWQSRQLETIGIEGNTLEEKSLSQLIFLDHLAAGTVRKPSLLLAPDAWDFEEPAGASLDAMRESLEGMGAALERSVSGAETGDVPVLARSLELLTEHGWRPSGELSLWRLYRMLADRAPDESFKRALLAGALRYADSARDAAALRGELESLSPSGGSPATELTRLDRIRGALLGLACGDALGAPAEFKPLEEVRRRWPNRLTEMVGGGPWAPGEWTDDTGMALCVAGGVITNPEDPVPETGRRFLEWRRTAKDVGATVAAALDAFTDSWPAAARSILQARQGKAAGNGSLMRTLPVALAYTSPDEIRQQSARLSAMTHWDPQAEVCCLVYCLWVRELLQGTRMEAAWHAALEEARDRADSAKPVGGTPGPVPLPSRFWHRLETVENLREGELQPTGYAGYVVDCLEAAAWCCLKAGSLEQTLVLAVNLGGEADTIAAVAGGAAGAYWGIERIPERWLTALHERKRIEQAALQLAGVSDHLELYRSKPGIPRFAFSRVTDRILSGRNPLSRLDVQRLVTEGVTHILDLREEHEWSARGRIGKPAVEAIRDLELQYCSVPIPDRSAPDDAALAAAYRFLTDALETRATRVYVHCRGGIERTGAILTAWAARQNGVSCSQALASLQAANGHLRPLTHQIEAVKAWLRVPR